MKEKCSNPDCAAPVAHCHEGESDYRTCINWKKNNSDESKASKIPEKSVVESNVSWTGEAFQPDDLLQISGRSTPIYIGVIGKAAAAKTTFLAMLYTLLFDGKKLKDYEFVGSNTLIGWDRLYHRLKIYKGKVKFPDPTPSEYYRLFHIALRDKNDLLKDVFLSDAAGEVFSLWSQNCDDINAENARRIYDTSNAFILFIDCVDLIDRKNMAKTEILDIAQMLLHELDNRPVVAVWSKSDREAEIHRTIKTSLSKELSEMFTNFLSIEISNFSTDEPDKLVHSNNLEVIDWLLDKVMTPEIEELRVNRIATDDLFLDYAGK